MCVCVPFSEAGQLSTQLIQSLEDLVLVFDPFPQDSVPITIHSTRSMVCGERR